MKYIELNFMPIRINRKYSEAIKEITNDSNVILFNKYSTKIKLFRNSFNKVSVSFEFDDFKYAADIENELIRLYGYPEFISFSLLKTWKFDDFYLSFGEEEYKNNCTHLVINLTLLKPLVMIKYSNYLKRADILLGAINNWNIRMHFKPQILLDKSIFCVYDTESFQYTILLKGKSLELYSHEMKREVNGLHLVPHYRTKYKLGKNKTVNELIDSYFEYMEEYDLNLKHC